MPETIITQSLVIDTAAGEFRYTITGVTPRCWWLTADHTGATRQFSSRRALDRGLEELTAFLYRKHGRPVEAVA